MPEVKVDKNTNTLSISGKPDVTDYPLLSEIFGEVGYDIRLQAADELSKALEGRLDDVPADDIELLNNLKHSLSFKSEMGSVQLEGDLLKLDLKQIPIQLVYDQDRLLATTHSREFSEGLSDEIDKRFKVDWGVTADTKEPESSAGNISIESEGIKTEYSVSRDNHKIIFSFTDPESKVSGKLICDKKEGKDPRFSVFLQESERTIFLSFDPQQSLLIAEGGLPLTEQSNIGLGAEIAAGRLSEAFRVSYLDEGLGRINFELKFNQSRETGSGFEANLSLELSHF